MDDPQGPVSPRGLNIQFGMASASTDTSSLASSPVSSSPPPRMSGDSGMLRVLSETKRANTAVSSGLLSDLRQVQRELSWLARTENHKLRMVSPHMSPRLKSDPRRRSMLSDDSNDTFVDDDGSFYEDEKPDLSAAYVSEEYKVLGSEFDLRNAVIQRLAEIREKRSANQEAEIGLALLQIFRDLKVLSKAIKTWAALNMNSQLFTISMLCMIGIIMSWVYLHFYG